VPPRRLSVALAVPTRRLSAALAATLVASSGCDLPRFQGPQIQSPPANFLINAENLPARRIFPDRPTTFHTAWVHTDIGGASVIYVDGHAGPTTFEEVLAAREGFVATELDPDGVFGEIEVIRIDGRQAWGWYQRIQSERRGLVQVTYRAVVPYDTVSYAIEFVSGEPTLKGAAPDTLRAIVSSFAIGRTTYDVPKIAIGAGALLLLVAFARGRARERSDRMRSINLVRIEKKEDEASDAADADAAGGASRP